MLEILTNLSLAAGGVGGIWNSIVHDFSNIGEPAALAAFGQVLMIDIMLAGDNAIVVGALAAGLPADQRKKVILIGIIAALVLRIFFALLVTQLMQIVGLILAGGILLLLCSRWAHLSARGLLSSATAADLRAEGGLEDVPRNPPQRRVGGIGRDPWRRA